MAHLQAELLVDLEGLLEHLIADSDLADCRAIEVVEPVDVVLHARLVRLDGRDDQQVLQDRPPWLLYGTDMIMAVNNDGAPEGSRHTA